MENLETVPTTSKLALKWGPIAGLVLVVYGLIMQITGLIANLDIAPLYYLILLLALGFAMFKAMDEYKDTHGGYISFGQAFGLNTLISLIASIISTAVSIIYSTFIDDSGMKNMMAAQKEKMIDNWEKAGMSEREIDNALEMSEKMMAFFRNPGMMFISGVISITIIGVIIGLIAAAIKKKNKPVFE